MMSAQRDWRRPLLIRRSATAAPCLAARRTAPFIPRAGCRDLTVILVATLRGGRRSGFAQVVALPSKSFVACVFTLRFRVTLGGRAARLPSRFVPQRASLRGCQMCAMSAVIV